MFEFVFYYVLLGCILLLAGCSEQASTATSGKTLADSGGYEVLSLRYQGVTGAVSFPELAEDLGYLAPIKLDYIGNTISGPQDIQAVVTHDADFGTAFNGAIIKLRAAGLPIKAVIGSYGSDTESWFGYYVTSDSPIKNARDLIGKKIAVNTLGAHHEFMIREYLARNGLSQQEIEQVELVVIPPVNTEQVLRNKQVDAASLGGILKDVALERGGLRLLFSDTELYGPFTAGSYVFNEDFIEKKPQTVAKFVEATAKAIEWARNTPKDEVVARFRQIIAKRGRNESDAAIAYWKSTGIAAQGGLILDSEFQTWIDWLVRDGRLQTAEISVTDVFDNRFNPYRLDDSQRQHVGQASL